ncbi:RhoGAP domain protein [Necator americanus]|uniref:RhoGAP domain protein n=1 Tax=Necator americanus TaxID=51031 RepID=W2TWY2_NECAM|nr:RhoGAP domain protein [Necator americanus]ETN86590.1 RhoGAP domain protein [Necator americanus]
MSLFSTKKLSLPNGDGNSEQNGAIKQDLPAPVKELPPSPVEKEYPLRVNDTSRSVAPSVDSFAANSIPFDQFEKVVEIAEIPENISDTVELVNAEISSGDHANGSTVAYFGDVSLHIGKKERKKAHCRLRNMELSFHEDDTTEDCIAGPFSLLGCELICREEQTITIRLNERETTKVVTFSAEKDSETWILLLGEVQIVDKCLRFVAAYGIRSEGIYRRNGKISEAKDIYKRLTEDPVRTHIASTSEETAYAVADVLRQFFRRLKSPLVPVSIHKEIYKLVDARNTCDNAIRYAEYRRVLQQMPLIHYHTLRKLMAHLSEVVKYCDVNKASVENVAKVFGPSLFHTDDELKACFDDTTQQIGAVIDLINGYDVIFEVTSREEICRAMVEQAQLHKATTSNAVRADGLLVPIHVWERENRPFNVKIDLAAEEVCREAVARRGFDAPQDGNYAIFEVIMDGALSRRLTLFEKLSRTVIDHWLTWQCTDGYLLFDHDNWPYNDSELDFFSGKVKIAEPGSKTFHSYEMKVEEGVKIAAYKHDKLWKEWKVSDSIFYSGCCANRKAPNPYNVTVFEKKGVCMTDKFLGYCISFRLMPERTRFLNVIQFIETGGQPPPLVHL